jgi:hypothetical protein
MGIIGCLLELLSFPAQSAGLREFVRPLSHGHHTDSHHSILVTTFYTFAARSFAAWFSSSIGPSLRCVLLCALSYSALYQDCF